MCCHVSMARVLTYQIYVARHDASRDAHSSRMKAAPRPHAPPAPRRSKCRRDLMPRLQAPRRRRCRDNKTLWEALRRALCAVLLLAGCIRSERRGAESEPRFTPSPCHPTTTPARTPTVQRPCRWRQTHQLGSIGAVVDDDGTPVTMPSPLVPWRIRPRRGRDAKMRQRFVWGRPRPRR